MGIPLTNLLNTYLKAHQYGIRVVLDFIPNHSSDLHPWFQKSLQNEAPYSDYYVWADPKGYDENGQPIPPSNWVSLFNGIWFPKLF